MTASTAATSTTRRAAEQWADGAKARVAAELLAGDGATGPYSQAYMHDVWVNLTGQSGLHWGRPQSFTAAYANNRRSAWAYNAEGRVVQEDSSHGRLMSHDAAGHYTQETERRSRGGGQTSLMVTDLRLTQGYDGDGRRAKREEHRTLTFNGTSTVTVKNTYYVRSSVLGGKAVAELGNEGQKVKGYVYAGGEVIVKQWAGFLYWRNANPVTGSTLETSTQGLTYASDEAAELDPQGRDVGRSDPYAVDEQADYVGSYEWAGSGFDRGGFGCQWGDGMPAPCSVVAFARNIGVLDKWENPVIIKSREPGDKFFDDVWDPSPDFGGYDYWAGADLQSSSELRRNPEWVERGGDDVYSGLFAHESGPQKSGQCITAAVQGDRRLSPTRGYYRLES